MKNIIKIKAILSSLLLILFIIVLLTGIGLHISPSGKIALKKLHTIAGYIMSGLIIIHLFLNRKIFLNELKTLFK